MERQNLAVLILAAGKGTRMKSDFPKVLCNLKGKPLIEYVVDVTKKLSPQRIVVIVGYQADKVIDKLKGEVLEFVLQKEQLGTGHAVRQAENLLKDFKGNILVLSGDVPLLREKSLRRLVEMQEKRNPALSLMTAHLEDPKGYGRIIRNRDHTICEIKEDKDLLETERNITEVNSGIYCFNKDFLFETLGRVNNRNAQNEYYLTDIVGLAVKQGLRVEGFLAENSQEIFGINTIDELQKAELFKEEGGEKR